MRSSVFAMLSGVASSLLLAGSAFGAPVLQDPPPTLDEASAKSDLTGGLGGADLMRPTVDDNGVNLLDGAYNLATTEVAVGPSDAGGLTYSRVFIANGWRDNVTGTISSSGSTFTISFGGASEDFNLSAGVYTPSQGGEATLVYNSSTQKYTYTSRDGIVVIFDKAYAGTTPFAANEGRATSLTLPGGLVTTYAYNSAVISGVTYHRLQSVTNNLGYHLKFEYASNSNASLSLWLGLSKVTGLNSAKDYCAPSANTCASLTGVWPTATYDVPSATVDTVTDSLSRVTRYAYDASNHLVGIRRPSSVSDSLTITYHSGTDRVATVANGVGTWTYSYAEAGSSLTTTVTDPLSHTRTVVATNGLLVSDADGLGHVVTYAYDGNGRLSTVTLPDGNAITYGYDSRDNITQFTHIPKSGSGLSNLTTYLSYDSTCTYLPKCNKVNSITDARGKVTDYTYDTNHGGVLSETLPLPVSGGVRPQTRYAYTSMFAYYKNSSGTFVAAPSPVFKVTSVSLCRTTASCSGGADETKTLATYGATGVANNLLPTAVTSGAGDGSLSTVTNLTYNEAGDLLTMDGPVAGTADLTRYRYDSQRQMVGIVGPDPDGAGALKHRASRMTYNSDGQITATEQGTVDSQSDGDWATFAPLLSLQTAYDAQGRKVSDKEIASSTTYAVTQYSYDAANRIDCAARRLNPGAFGSLPSPACSLGTAGSDGQDRIVKYSFDAADRLTNIQSGYGTSSQRSEGAAVYSNNNKRISIADGRGNKTTFEYDGFDRLKKTRYPLPNAPGSSSTTDYQELTYDAASRITQIRVRNGTSVSIAYDDLDRQITGFGGIDYTYNNINSLTSAKVSGAGSTFSYDALGRKTSEVSPLGTVGYQYDAAGRRSRLTWPDSVYVTYEYSVDGDIKDIKLNGTGTLASFAYDNLGRRSTLTRGNGVATTYSYDAGSRLAGISNDLSGTASDQALAFGRNAAGQVISRSNSNSIYDWSPPSSPTSMEYVSNGLNQYDRKASTDLAYDNSGNLASNGSKAFTYDAANRLTAAASATLAYDKLGRLYEVAGASTTRFLYDGAEAIAELNGSGTVQRRYVFGPGLDEPLVWFEGSGTSNPSYLVADQLGSIIAVTGNTGTASSINKYGENGEASSLNGRFGYTGQMWIPDADGYYFKARFYSPDLGRFFQPDPTGYDDGLNWYAYVQNDPVNYSDPYGTQKKPDEVDEVQIIGKKPARDPCQRPGVTCFDITDAPPSGTPREIIITLQPPGPPPEAPAGDGETKRCPAVRTRVLKGNASFIGKVGAWGGNRPVTVTRNSAAVIIQQFGFSGKGAMRPHLGKYSGYLNGRQLFSGVTDRVDNHTSPVAGMEPAEGLMFLNKGSVILEVTGLKDDLGTQMVVFVVPKDQDCPGAR